MNNSGRIQKELVMTYFMVLPQKFPRKLWCRENLSRESLFPKPRALNTKACQTRHWSDQEEWRWVLQIYTHTNFVSFTLEVTQYFVTDWLMTAEVAKPGPLLFKMVTLVTCFSLLPYKRCQRIIMCHPCYSFNRASVSWDGQPMFPFCWPQMQSVVIATRQYPKLKTIHYIFNPLLYYFSSIYSSQLLFIFKISVHKLKGWCCKYGSYIISLTNEDYKYTRF